MPACSRFARQPMSYINRGIAWGFSTSQGRRMAMPTTIALPAQFGRYYIVKMLGEGGMGAVYRAEDTELHRNVAVKVPKLNSTEDIQRFQREARVAAAIDHPNICQVLDFGSIDGIHYLTMPFVEGVPLASLIG